MFRTKSKKDAILHRLKIARGHLDKIIGLVEQDAYVMDIVLQSRAVQQALKKADEVLVENHLTTAIVPQIKKGKADVAVKEVLNILRRK